MKTSATNKKIRELIELIKSEKLIPRPEFQRRLVWKSSDKNLFLDSVIKGYPFPEIYVADGDVNTETGEGTQLLVDGLQRLTTLYEYFYASPDLILSTVPPYRSLLEDQKRDFLQYDVAVRDLGAVSRDQIVEVFQRINATKYSLKEIEVNNAVYQGEFKKFCEAISELNFFVGSGVFTAQDYKRMGDLRFAITLVITMMGGYFNRDEQFEAYLSRYNEVFSEAEIIRERFLKVIDFLEEVNFEKKSRIWRKADLLTALIELDIVFLEGRDISPSEFADSMQRLYESIDDTASEFHSVGQIYYKAALQASNDRVNRVRRGVIVRGMIRDRSSDEILADLRGEGLISNP